MLKRFIRELDQPVASLEEGQQQEPSLGAVVVNSIANDLTSPISGGQRREQSGIITGIIGDLNQPITQPDSSGDRGAVAKAVEGLVTDSILPINTRIDANGNLVSSGGENVGLLQAIGIGAIPSISGHVAQEGVKATVGLWGDLNRPFTGPIVSEEEAARINAVRQARINLAKTVGKVTVGTAGKVVKGAGRLAWAGAGLLAGLTADKIAEAKARRSRRNGTSTTSREVITIDPQD